MRNEDQYSKNVILVSTLVGAISVAPFILIRLLEKNWAVFFIDTLLVATFLGCFFYVYYTSKVNICKWIVSGFFLTTASITIYLKGPEQLPWLFPSMVGVFFLLGRRWGSLANLLTLVVVMGLTWQELTWSTKLVWILTLAGTNAFAYVFSLSNSHHRKQLSALSKTDPLTKAGNRRAFDQAMRKAIELATNNYQPLLLIIDIDHFKLINDNYGHSSGDKVLSQITLKISSVLREKDLIFRIGGEEFALLVETKQEDGGEALGERIHQAVKTMGVDDITVTVSIGIASLQPNDTYETWYNRADVALYQAKKEGRDKTVIATTE